MEGYIVNPRGWRPRRPKNPLTSNGEEYMVKSRGGDREILHGLGGEIWRLLCLFRA